jgi:hypothetical protein
MDSCCDDEDCGTTNRMKVQGGKNGTVAWKGRDESSVRADKMCWSL